MYGRVCTLQGRRGYGIKTGAEGASITMVKEQTIDCGVRGEYCAARIHVSLQNAFLSANMHVFEMLPMLLQKLEHPSSQKIIDINLY